jgi:hypothetical protein
MVINCLPHSLQNPSDGPKALSHGSGESGILPEKPDVMVRTSPAGPRPHLLAPGFQNFRLRAGILNECLFQPTQIFNNGQTRPDVNTA